jgi:hypothetical protein
MSEEFVVLLPEHMAEQTLRKTLADIPADLVD